MRLLVVEDDERLAALLVRALKEDGYAVDATGDGAEALWLATEYDYDTVVLDRMLPGLDGMEVVRALRERGRSTPVLLLTARTGVDDRVTGLDAGADDYLTKPFDYDELAARIRALARRGGPARPPQLRHNDLILDPASRRVTRGGNAIELTAREFAVLELLLRHRGDVLTRAYILEHVWDFALDPSSNIVDQHVAALRRKVGREDVRTVRGTGYVIGEPTGRDAAG
jgi:two-component system, OmpR family, response regulator